MASSSQGSIENDLIVNTVQSLCSEEIHDPRHMVKAASRNPLGKVCSPFHTEIQEVLRETLSSWGRRDLEEDW